MAFEGEEARLARRAVSMLEAGEVRVETSSPRLSESVGIGPKDFARTVRLQRAMRLATIPKDWVRIGGDAGYYDQAHPIADFRELLGLTPGALLKRADDSGLRFRLQHGGEPISMTQWCLRCRRSHAGKLARNGVAAARDVGLFAQAQSGSLASTSVSKECCVCSR
jgi:hypothetical protein